MPTKCYLRSVGEAGSGNQYADLKVRSQNDNYRAEPSKRLLEIVTEPERAVAPTAKEDLKSAKWQLAADLPVQTTDMESMPCSAPRAAAAQPGWGREGDLAIAITIFRVAVNIRRLQQGASAVSAPASPASSCVTVPSSEMANEHRPSIRSVDRTALGNIARNVMSTSAETP
jgi:hypothetical protein